MTTKESEKIIEETAKSTAKAVVSELTKKGLVKTQKSPFQKTETLLYNYNSFQDVIKDKYLEIETIEYCGVPKKSASISTYSSQSFFDNRSEDEKNIEKIEEIEKSITITKNCIKSIDAALESLKNDPYYKIIEMKYFENKSREEIAEYFGVDTSTITRNKNRLINKLQIRFFSDEVIQNLLK